MSGDELPPLDSDLRALLQRAEGGAPSLPAGIEAHVLAKVGASTSLLGKLGGTKLVVGGVLAIVATLGALTMMRRAPHEVAPAPDVAPVVASAAPVAPVVAPLAPVAAPVVVPVVQPERTPPEHAAEDTGPAEGVLLEKARAALAAGDGAVALKALQDHQRRFPHGALIEERRALTVVAFAKLGDRQRAGAAARAFLREYPRSLFVDTVRAAAPE